MTDLAHALRLLAAGDWEACHKAVQDNPSVEAAWIHAHLHREEGDLPNARYWYARAGKPESTSTLALEREAIIAALRHD